MGDFLGCGLRNCVSYKKNIEKKLDVDCKNNK